MELTDRRGLHATHCNTSLGLLKANAPAVPSVFRNTPPADAEDESLRTAPEDWRAQSAEQKAAINQFHIAAIAEHFRKTGARVKQHAEDLPLDQRLANYIIEGTKDGLGADLDRKAGRGRDAARNHQRAADGRHERGGPPVQPQRTDCACPDCW